MDVARYGGHGRARAGARAGRPREPRASLARDAAARPRASSCRREYAGTPAIPTTRTLARRPPARRTGRVDGAGRLRSRRSRRTRPGPARRASRAIPSCCGTTIPSTTPSSRTTSTSVRSPDATRAARALGGYLLNPMTRGAREPGRDRHRRRLPARSRGLRAGDRLDRRARRARRRRHGLAVARRTAPELGPRPRRRARARRRDSTRSSATYDGRRLDAGGRRARGGGDASRRRRRRTSRRSSAGRRSATRSRRGSTELAAHAAAGSRRCASSAR